MLTYDHLSFPSDTDANLHGGMAGDPAGTYLFAGYLAGGNRHRQGLGVTRLDGSGKFLWYPETTLPLPETAAANASVKAIAYHPTLPVVYVAWGQSPTASDDRVLSYCPVVNGVPGTPVPVATALTGHNIDALAYHPTLPVLYMAGQGQSGISRIPLDLVTGHPSGAAVFFSFGPQGKVALAVNAAGTLLYAGTFPDTIQVFSIDPTTGALSGGTSFAAPAAIDTRGGFTGDYARFQLVSGGLWFRRNTGSGAFPSLWKLDGSGLPTGAFLDRTDIHLAENQWAFAGIQSRSIWAGTGASAGKFWAAEVLNVTDDYTSALVPRGLTVNRYTLNGDATLAASPVSEGDVWGATCCRLWAHPNGTVVVAKGGLSVPSGAPGNLVSGMQARFTVTAATGGPSPQFPRTFQLLLRFPGGSATNVTVSALNTPSAWVSLDTWLKNSQADGPHNVFDFKSTLAVPYFTALTVTIEIADKNTVVLATLTATTAGTEVHFCVPGYAYGPASIRTAQITTWAQVLANYKATAAAVALPEGNKPTRYPITGAQVYGVEISSQEFGDLFETLHDLGMNCCNPQIEPTVPQGLAAGALDALATSKGIPTFHDSFYDPVDPPGEYFHYLPDIQSPTLLDAWIGSHFVTPGQASQDRLFSRASELGISDEPRFLQPTHINEVRNTPAYLLLFQAWAQSYFSPRYTPASFVPGAVSWNDAGIRPILDSELAAANTAGNRLLFFATHRFFPWSMAQQYLLTSQSIDRVIGSVVPKRANWNNIPNQLYIPGAAIQGGPGWYDVGRLGSHHPKTESWIASCQAELWFLWLDVLRYVGLINPLGFSPGCFITASTLTGLTGVGKAFLLAALAAGCKFIEWYAFGPDPIFALCWSEQADVYGEIATANTLLAGCEDHLFDAVPAFANVAVLNHSVGQMWDPADGAARLFHEEPLYYTSLVCHARGPNGEKWSVDHIDEDEIRRGALSRYSALHLSSPNIAQDVQNLIAAAFNAGTLSLSCTPGAGALDEKNDPTETLTACFGLAAGRAADRTASVNQAGYSTREAQDTVIIGSDPNYGTAGATFRACSRKAPLTLTTAVAKATFSTGGGVAIAERVSPAGGARAVSFGCFPGTDHWCSPARNVAPTTYNSNQFAPRNWDPVVQRAGVGGLIAAGVAPAYLMDRGDITVSLQRSFHGISAVAQNWTGLPQTGVVLSVPLAADARVPRAARSQVSGVLPFVAVGANAQVTLPTLAEGDVLLLEYDPARNPATTSGGAGVCSTATAWSPARTS